MWARRVRVGRTLHQLGESFRARPNMVAGRNWALRGGAIMEGNGKTGNLRFYLDHSLENARIGALALCFFSFLRFPHHNLTDSEAIFDRGPLRILERGAISAAHQKKQFRAVQNISVFTY